MNLAPPTSQFESFESELIRRFFHPKSYFYLCFTNQIEILAQSESEISSAAVNTINRLVTNLVSAGDAYAEWKQLVRQPGLEDLHLLLSGKIIWLSNQNYGGEELRHAIESIARALIENFLELFRQENTRRKLTNFLEGEMSLPESPSDFLQPAEQPECDAANFDIKQERDDFSEITTKLGGEGADDFFNDPVSDESRPDDDTTLEFEEIEINRSAEAPPETTTDEVESRPESQPPENPLFAKFKTESISAIQAIVEKYHSIKAPEQIEKQVRLLRKKLSDLKELSMIQGYDMIEDFSFKLLNVIPALEKSDTRFKRAYLEVTEDTLHLMLNWLNNSASESEIREKFGEIQSLAMAINEVSENHLFAGTTSRADAMQPISGAETGVLKSEAVAEKPKDEPIRWPEDKSDPEMGDVAEIIFNSAAEKKNDLTVRKVDHAANQVPENLSNESERVIEAVPVIETDDDPGFLTVEAETNTETDDLPEGGSLMQLPGEDDGDLKQLINDILTAKNDGMSGINLDSCGGSTETEHVAVSNAKQISEVTETDLFKSEAALYLKIIEDALMNLQEQPYNLTFLEDIELSAYSIKRLAQKMGFELLSRLPAQIESNMADLAKKRKKVSREIIKNISEAIHFMNNLEENDLTIKDKLKNILNLVYS